MELAVQNGAPTTSLAYRFARSQAKGKLLKLARRIAFYRQMAKYAERGFDLKTPIELMLERAVRRKNGTAVLLEEWVFALNNGARFADVLAGLIPPAERMAIAAGEDTGQLEDGFRNAAFIAATSQRMRKETVKSLSYPTLLSLAFMALLIVVGKLLMPTLEEVLPLDLWPTMSAALYWVSQLAINQGPWILVGMTAALAASIVALPRWVGPQRKRLDHWLPPFNVYRRIQGASMLVIVAALMEAGMPFDEALRRARRVASAWARSHIDVALLLVNEGARPSSALDIGLLDDEIVDDLAAYDRAGDVGSAARDIGIDAVEGVLERFAMMGNIASVIIILMVGLGLVWTWSAFAMVFMAARSGGGF